MCSKNGESPNIDQFITNIIEKEGFIQYRVFKKCVSTNGGNYLGDLNEFDVKGKTKESDKEISIFVKSMFRGENNIKIISIVNVYKTELYFYKELSKIFDELQEESHIPLNKRYKTVKSYDESNDKAIIMENLSRKGFTTGHRMEVVSLKLAEMAIQELAKFHALSFSLKVKRPEYFERRIQSMKSPYITGKAWEGFVQNMLKTTMSYVDDSVKDRVEMFSFGIGEKFAKYYTDKTRQRCMCHGDYRQNNILTKFTKGEATEIIPVDFQLLYYGCPVIDLIYFIICSTDSKFRRAHLSHLKDLYFETLKGFLKYFNIDINLVYSRKEFENDYKECIEYGLTLTLVILPLMFASETDVPDITKEELSDMNFQIDDRFEERFRGVLDDYVEWGVL